MFMLKHTYALSDEQVWERWVHDPYFQYFTGEEFFRHELVHERSGMSHWRKRIGGRLDILLQESLRIAHYTGALATGTRGRSFLPTPHPPWDPPRVLFGEMIPRDLHSAADTRRQRARPAGRHVGGDKARCGRIIFMRRSIWSNGGVGLCEQPVSKECGVARVECDNSRP